MNAPRGPEPSQIVKSAPDLVPFVAPEILEARLGVKFRLRLGSNESVFGPSPLALEAIREAATRASHYGDPQSLRLREALAERHQTSTGGVLVASGIDDLLLLMTRTYVNPGAAVVTSKGTYPTFDFAAMNVGAQIVRVPYQNDSPDLDGLAAAAREHQASIVYLANPDNPSGAYHLAERVRAFRRNLPENSLLVLDEAYADFVPASELPEFDPEDRGLVRLRTFSKAHGLAGLRIGFALGHPVTLVPFEKTRLHFGVNSIAQAAALASIEDDSHLPWVIDQVAEGRELLATAARAVGAIPLPSMSNFVTMRVGSRERAEAILKELLRDGVFIRKPAQPPLDDCIRVTVGTASQCEEFGEALRHVCETIT